MAFLTLGASAWPAQTAESLRPSTVGSTLFEAAQARPDATALVAPAAGGGDFGRWSFDRLVEEAEGAARALLGRFQPGERVAVWAPNVAEFFLPQLGAGLAGLTLVPIPLALRQRDLGHLLGQSAATGLFLVPEYRGVAMAEILEEVRPQLPRLREVVDLSDWSEFLASSVGSSPFPPVDPRSTAQVQYTSGSTGLPKGALLHHQQRPIPGGTDGGDR